MNIIVTGPKGAGKSEHLLRLALLLKSRGKKCAGVISRGIWAGAVRAGYEIVDPSSGESVLLCRRSLSSGSTGDQNSETDGATRFCSYKFFDSAFALGNRWISGASGADALFIDEIGNMELSGRGWNVEAARRGELPLVLGVKEEVAPKLEAAFGITGEFITIKPGADMLEDIVLALTGGGQA